MNYPTCGEISCEECNDRYEKAMDRIEAKKKQYPSWTKADEVNEMGCYWHWDGDMNCSPEIVYIQYSGSRGVYFASMGQLGWTEAQDVLDMGGWWKRVPHPPNEELRRLLNEQLPVVRGKSADDDDQMTDGWLRSVGGVEPDYTEDFTETTFCFDLDNDHCLNVEVDTQRVYIYDAQQEHVAIELPHIKTCGQFLKLLSSGIRQPLPSPPASPANGQR